MATVRLLGPDLGDENLIVEGLETSQTILDLKEKALKNWPAGKAVPLIGQIKIIHQGRFVTDEKQLKDCKCADGETTAMHLVIKAQVSKAAESTGSDADKAGSRCTCIIS